MQKLINSGIYILEIFAKSPFKLEHNRFGSNLFSKGYYYYVGSAQKNLTQRIQRHIKKYKKQHWHIDYLTCNKNVEIKNIYVIKDLPKKHECILNKELVTKYHLQIPIKGFGSSDCNNCESHLLYSKIAISYNQLCALYHSTVLFMPSSSDIC